MSSYCAPCDRTFASGKALEQHKQNSPAHENDCRTCDRHFGTHEALSQHYRSAVVHNTSKRHECDDCDRAFESASALQQHVQNSSAHQPTFKCNDCDRSFNTQQALDQHLANSPAHAPSFDCRDCDRSFKDQQALNQHRSSPAHALSFDCGECNRNFGSSQALQQHLRDSPTHTQDSYRDINTDPHYVSVQTATNTCTFCRRPFRSEAALRQHQRDSPAHTLTAATTTRSTSNGLDETMNWLSSTSQPPPPYTIPDESTSEMQSFEPYVTSNVSQSMRTFDCNVCARSFRSETALEQHLVDSASCNSSILSRLRDQLFGRAAFSPVSTAAPTPPSFGDTSELNSPPRSHRFMTPFFRLRASVSVATDGSQSTGPSPNRLPSYRNIDRREVFPEEPPIHLIDTIISFDLIHEAVSTPNGDSYDRLVIERQIAEQGICPVTRLPLTLMDLRPNRTLQYLADKWKEEQRVVRSGHLT